MPSTLASRFHITLTGVARVRRTDHPIFFKTGMMDWVNHVPVYILNTAMFSVRCGDAILLKALILCGIPGGIDYFLQVGGRAAVGDAPTGSQRVDVRSERVASGSSWPAGRGERGGQQGEEGLRCDARGARRRRARPRQALAEAAQTWPVGAAPCRCSRERVSSRVRRTRTTARRSTRGCGRRLAASRAT